MSASIFKDVDFHPKINNTEHRTSEISVRDLIVRRGQAFTVTLTLNQPLNGEPLIITAYTGQHASEDRGTLSVFSLSESVSRSPTAKAVWRVGLDRSSSPAEGILKLAILPPPETPIGEWNLMVKHRDQDRHLATLTVLFNPWCTDDAVFLGDEDQRQEYVMNEQGIIYKGSGNYIAPRPWDFGQFEENMTKICLKILDVNVKHEADPADDDSARCNVVYVSRVVSAMINSRDDRGVILGRWSDSFWGGTPPNHWSGSHEILNKWFRSDCRPVRYGQCWVFAGVMCSVLRLLGIPCRPVTNYQSAHDSNENLIIDVYHANYGVREKRTRDSVWNYHVWVEAWMKRPDLAVDGSYDGWQVLDPTPQEKSNGVYCLGPASVKAVLNGKVDLTYDTPFVYAEVNADCIDWMVNKDGSETQFLSDTKRIGQNISTKTVGTRKRLNITDSYKQKEGTEEERTVFKYALSRDYSEADGSEDTEEEEEEEENEPAENGENKPVVNGSDGENVNAVVNGGERDVPGESGEIEGTVGNEENKPVVNGGREGTNGSDGEREAPDVNGENKPVGNGENKPVGNGDNKPVGNGENKPVGNGENKPVGNGDNKPVGNGDNKPVGNGENKPVGNGDNKPVGNGDNKPVGNGENKPVGNGENKPVGNGENKPVGNGDNKPVGNGDNKPVGNGENKPVGNGENKPVGNGDNKPVGNGENKPVGNGDNKPVGNGENKPVGNGENKPVGNGDNKPVGNGDNKPVGNGENKPVGNGENKPVGNGENKPVGNGDNKPVGNGENKPVGNGENKPVGNRGVVAVENTETFGTSGPTDVNPGNASTPNEPATDDPHLKLRFKEMSIPRNGKDVRLKLVLLSHRRGNRPVSININVQGMTYNGGTFQLIQHETTEKTLPFGKDVSVPIVVPFSAYSKAMLHSDSMKVSAVVVDTDIPNGTYLAEGDIVLLDPPISVSVSGELRVGVETMGQLVFMNPVQEKLQKCTLTLSGSGLWREPVEYQISDLKPNTRIIIKFPILPYKAGWKTLMADFDCSLFRDITCSCTFKVMH